MNEHYLQHFPTNIRIVADEHVDIAPVDFTRCEGRVYVLAHVEALSQIPLPDDEIARHLRITIDELAALRESPNELTLLQRLAVAMLLAATADRDGTDAEHVAFRRFLAHFLERYALERIANKAGDAVALAVMAGSPTMAYQAVLDTIVDVGGVELLEYLPRGLSE